MSTLEIIQGTTTLDISDEQNFVHELNEGFGMPPLHYLTERGPFQHGESVVDVRLDPRIVNLVIPLLATWDTHFDRRESLLAILSPSSTPIILRFTSNTGIVRQMDCWVLRGPLFSTEDQIAGGPSIRAGMSLIAYDPTWYDPVAVSVRFQLGGGSDTFTVPMSVPHGVGASTIDSIEVMQNDGTWITYPMIRVTGPITNPVIENETTGEILDFTGFTISAGEYYDIDLRYGYKTVLENGSVNKVSELTDDSDLATFHLEKRQANSIRVTGSAITGETVIDFLFFEKYVGI
jgi:hypothetical protein